MTGLVETPAGPYPQLPRGPLVAGAERADGPDEGRPVIDPSTGTEVTRVTAATPADVAEAVGSCRAAFEGGRWRRLGPRERQAVLLEIADLIDRHGDELVELEMLQTGKPISRLPGEVHSAAETFRYYAGWTTKVFGDTNPTDPSRFGFTLREPVGVCAGIIPWNYPLVLAAWKVAPALALGNTIVLKPDEQTPLTALRLGHLALQAGVPAGVFNVVTGDGRVGELLCRHPEIDKVAFTGSTATGRWVAATCAAGVKRVSLELGGKSPIVVFADTHLEAAVRAMAAGAFSNAGQMCVAASRALVEREVYPDVVARIASLARDIVVGPAADPATQMGPLISARHRRRVVTCIEKGRSQGAELVCGGTSPPVIAGYEGGFYLEPTVFAGASHDMGLARQEIFGPVLALIPFSGEDEAVRLANDTRYGLAASVWTPDIARAHRVARRLRAGMVWVNTFGDTDDAVSVGGYGESGYGRELGRYSLDLYTETKCVWVSLE